MRDRFVTPLIWIISFFIVLFLFSKLFGPLPFSVNSVTTTKSTTFDVSAEGKATAKPDIAMINAGITVQGQTVKNAQDQINNIINKVSSAVKGSGVEEKDIQTQSYNINPTYDFSGAVQRITGYNASTALRIKARNLDNINNVIDAATANGANQISGVLFDIENKNKLEDDARREAVEKAKQKAGSAASIAGFKLGRIVNYSENKQGFPRPVTPLMMEAADKAVGSPSTQIEPGSSEISITVTLSYEIF